MKDKKNKTKPNGADRQAQVQQVSAPSRPQPEQQVTNFLIQRLFTKGVSFDAPQISSVFGKEWQPKLDINIQMNNSALVDNMHEVELNVTITGKKDEQTIFTINVIQAGIFTLQNFSQDQLAMLLGSECPKILYPYIRETINDLTNRATLPQFYLTPINFDAIYAQQLAQQKANPSAKNSQAEQKDGGASAFK